MYMYEKKYIAKAKHFATANPKKLLRQIKTKLLRQNKRFVATSQKKTFVMTNLKYLLRQIENFAMASQKLCCGK